MTLRKITVIGTGSFGGFLCKHLSELESVKQLYIIDNDIVEAKQKYNMTNDTKNIVCGVSASGPTGTHRPCGA